MLRNKSLLSFVPDLYMHLKSGSWKREKLVLISFCLSEESEVLSSSKWVKATKTTVMKLWWVTHCIIFKKVNQLEIIHDVGSNIVKRSMTSLFIFERFDWFFWLLTHCIARNWCTTTINYLKRSDNRREP